MARAPKAPTQRKKNRSDERTIRIETTSMPLAVAVAVIAALISFVALTWVGDYMGMTITPWGWRVSYAPLLPLALDGFGIICALGIVRSHGTNEPLVKRVSEWGGLVLSLSLSMAGNVVHTLHIVDGATPPRWLLMAYSAVIPAIVAYGLHLLGRTIQNGILSRINVDDPDHVQLDTPAEPPATPTRRPRPTAQPASGGAARAAVAEARAATPTQSPATVGTGKTGAKDRTRQLVAEAVRAGQHPSSKAIHEQLVAEGYDDTPHYGTTRNWVPQEHKKLIEELDASDPGQSRPDLHLAAEARGDDAAATA